MNISVTSNRSPHEGRITLILLASIIGIAYGIWYAYSVFLVAFLDDFGWSRSSLAGAFSLFAIVHGCMNPLVGFLCDRIRPALIMALGSLTLEFALYSNRVITAVWHRYITFGLLTSVSVSLCGWTPSVVIVQKRFQHRLGLALGIVSSGIGVGMLVIVPLCQFFIDSFGWRVAFQIFALIGLIVILPSALFLLKNSNPLLDEEITASTNTQPDRQNNNSGMVYADAIKSRQFWYMASAFFFGGVCSQTLHVHQVAYLVDHGIAALTASGIVGLVGIASIIGKTGGGWMSDYIERELVYVSGISIMVLSVLVLLMVGSIGSLTGAYIYAILLGVGYSATAALMPAMMSDRFEGDNFGSILGTALFGSALGAAFGPWMGGYLFDLFGSYIIPFSIAATCGIIAAVSGWNARKLRVLNK